MGGRNLGHAACISSMNSGFASRWSSTLPWTSTNPGVEPSPWSREKNAKAHRGLLTSRASFPHNATGEPNVSVP
ncbi:MAG: hypothetical protein R2698_12365 [Microthrixaceae bacterium]